MTQGGGGSPIFFEGVYADCSRGGIDVGMVDFGEEVASGRGVGEVGGED